MAAWVSVPAAVLEAVGRAVVEADGREVAVFRVGDAVYAVENACPHAGNPLVEGDLAGTTLTCVYHLWRFDLETGACLSGEHPARTYRAELRGEELWIDLDGNEDGGTTS